MKCRGRTATASASRNAESGYTPASATVTARPLTSTPSTRKLPAGSPASSRVRATLYASSPVLHGTHNTRSGRPTGTARRRSTAHPARWRNDSGYRRNHVSGTTTASTNSSNSRRSVCTRLA